MLSTPTISPEAAALFKQATLSAEGGRLGEAVGPLVECLRHAPDFGAGYVNLAYILHRLGVLEQALAMAMAGHALLPASKEAALNLAAILHDSGDYPAALALYQRLLAPDPAQPGVLRSIGRTLRAMGRLDEALSIHARATAAAPDDADAHYNHADALLAAGDFAAGWAEYEWRLRRPHARPRRFSPAWRGEDLAGQTILLHAEQGFGDTIQFSRYAPMVAARGGRVVMEVQRPLLSLMRSLDGVADCVAQGNPLPHFTAHCPMMSLPLAFGAQLDTIPATIPYLHADPAQMAAWRDQLPQDGALRVGLVWAGSSHPTAAGVALDNLRRSLPLAALAPLGDVPGVRFVSLQAGPPAQQLRTPPPGLTLLDPMAAVTDFAGTAAIVANLDLVISVDTAVAHLAGALGRPVWVLCRSDGCWRWLTGRDDSPWYPTLRLYRQTNPLDWASVVTRVRTDLAALATRA